MRQEYLAVGIRLALHPTADLATEPRWCRAAGTFGEDADLVASLVTVFLRGMQLETLGRQLDVPVYRAPAGAKVVDIATGGVEAGLEQAGSDYRQALLSYWNARIEFEKALGEEP